MAAEHGPLLVAPERFPDPVIDIPAAPGAISDVVVLAGGCFWCTEAVFREIEGVKSVQAGYVGGTAETADYQSVCSGTTGHAEAIEIRFDPRVVSFGQILKLFFSVAHDPTQKDRQGNDVGRQYRSAVFCRDDDQQRVAAAYIAQLDRAGVFDRKIVTTIEPLTIFHEAEGYHQDYAARNPLQPYIQFVSAPKVAKLRKHFPHRLRGGG